MAETQAKPQKEPSMEEILASIRRIISEDGEPGDAAAKPAAKPVSNGAAEAESVLELTQEVDAEGNPVPPAPKSKPAPAAKAGQDDIDAIMAASAKAPPAEPEPVADDPIAESDEQIVGDNAAAAAAASFAALNQRVAPPRAAAGPRSASFGGRTVEELAEDLLRPMLQQWLDENLPPMVERLVAREVERIARRSQD